MGIPASLSYVSYSELVSEWNYQMDVRADALANDDPHALDAVDHELHDLAARMADVEKRIQNVIATMEQIEEELAAGVEPDRIDYYEERYAELSEEFDLLIGK
jgi:hypothetical protein